MATREITTSDSNILDAQDTDVVVGPTVSQVFLPAAGNGTRNTVRVGHKVQIRVPGVSPVTVLTDLNYLLGRIPAYRTASIELDSADPLQWHLTVN